LTEQTELAIQAMGLTRTFTLGETEIHALRGIDLDVAAGRILRLRDGQAVRL
jgi:hypothetical protein